MEVVEIKDVIEVEGIEKEVILFRWIGGFDYNDRYYRGVRPTRANNFTWSSYNCYDQTADGGIVNVENKISYEKLDEMRSFMEQKLKDYRVELDALKKKYNLEHLTVSLPIIKLTLDNLYLKTD